MRGEGGDFLAEVGTDQYHLVEELIVGLYQARQADLRARSGVEAEHAHGEPEDVRMMMLSALGRVDHTRSNNYILYVNYDTVRGYNFLST